MRRLYRPEDISRDLAHGSGLWDVYAAPVGSPELVDVRHVMGKAAARLHSEPVAEGGERHTPHTPATGRDAETFLVVGSFDPATNKHGPAPLTLAVDNGELGTELQRPECVPRAQTRAPATPHRPTLLSPTCVPDWASQRVWRPPRPRCLAAAWQGASQQPPPAPILLQALPHPILTPQPPTTHSRWPCHYPH